MLTREQRKAVQDNDNALIVACPGSGKTRTLVAKLLRCLEEVKDTSRRLACITYTNAGVYEIEHRLRASGRTGDEAYCDVSTIHSFCLNNILHYFHWLLPEYKDGFTVLPSDSDEYHNLVASICKDHRLDVHRVEEAFGLLGREPNGDPITGTLDKTVATDFWKRLQDRRLIDYPNLVYYSYRLLIQRPSIAHALAAKYAWILVDEFQDTSSLQVEILKLIAQYGKTKYFLVGDPYQSIFGFAGAKPDLMDEFSLAIDARQDFRLLENFRSSQLIVNQAEILCPRTPCMCAAGPTSGFPAKPQYIHTATSFEGIRDYFLPALNELRIDYGQSAILAPWWFKLLPLGKQLREYGVPIVGPGARPYKKSHILAPLAENICSYIEHSTAATLHRIEKELFQLIHHLEGHPNYLVYSYRGRVVTYKLVYCGTKLRDECESGIRWLKRAAKQFATILIDEGFLSTRSRYTLDESVLSMEADMVKHKVDVANLSVTDLGMFASTDHSMKLMTMHAAKGREFDAVALIDMHDGHVPDYRATTPDEIDEGKRLLYVAITRAKKLLLYVTDEENVRNRPSRFLLNEGLGLSPSNVD